MKCVQFEASGEPCDVLQHADRDEPTAKYGEVVVRMLASPINPSDMMFVRGIYGVQPQPPQIPGFEGVGIVEASGGGLKGKLFAGKRVAVLNKAGGNWAERTAVPADQVIPLSNKLSVEQAATFFVNPATAWIMTQEVLRVTRGAWLLQTAATSSLGKMVIRLGRALGFRTLNIVRRESAVDALKSAGATAVVVFDAERDSAASLQKSVARIVGSDGLGYAIDPVGGLTASAVAQSLTADGRLLLYGTLTNQPLQFSPRTLMQNQAAIEGFWLGNFMSNKGLLYKLRLVKRITRLILDGTLATDIQSTYPLEEIHSAVLAAEKSGRTGKTLLKMSSGM
jgi:NADPH:quinone reductase